MCIISFITTIIGILGGIAGIASAIYTWIFQRQTKRFNIFFEMLKIYTDTTTNSKCDKNGFVLHYFPNCTPHNSPELFQKQWIHDIEFYHEIKIQASAFLSVLNYACFHSANEEEKTTMLSFLIPLLNVNRQRDYYCFLHISHGYPALRAIKQTLKERGIFASPEDITDSYLEQWGEKLYEQLSRKNNTTNI